MTGKWMIDPLTKTVNFRWSHLSEERARMALARRAAAADAAGVKPPFLRLAWGRGFPRRSFGDLAASAGG